MPPSQQQDAVSMPSQLEKATLQALSKATHDRFESAAAFGAALRDSKPSASAADHQHPCADCGASSPDSFKFCPECGAAKATERKEFDLSLEDTGHEEIWSDQAATADISAADLQGMFLPGEREPTTEKLPEPIGTISELFPLPVIGHQSELDALVDFLASERSGVMHLRNQHGGVRERVLGKAFSSASKQGCLIFLASPDPTCQQTPFYPIRAIVAATLDLPALCSYDEIGSALEDIGLSRRDAPGIGELFQHEGAGLSKLEAPIRRRELFASTMRVLRAAGKQLSAVLAFENYYLFDRPSPRGARYRRRREGSAYRGL